MADMPELGLYRSVLAYKFAASVYSRSLHVSEILGSQPISGSSVKVASVKAAPIVSILLIELTARAPRAAPKALLNFLLNLLFTICISPFYLVYLHTTTYIKKCQTFENK